MSRVSASDRAFLAAFEKGELSAAEFHHREHLRIAYIYLTLHPPDVALGLMRIALQRFLAVAGAPASKYHETMTAAWLLAVHRFMRARSTTSSFAEFAESAGVLLDQQMMKTHYTPELLTSDTARCGFVEPDLQPIPRSKNMSIGGAAAADLTR